MIQLKGKDNNKARGNMNKASTRDIIRAEKKKNSLMKIVLSINLKRIQTISFRKESGKIPQKRTYMPIKTTVMNNILTMLKLIITHLHPLLAIKKRAGWPKSLRSRIIPNNNSLLWAPAEQMRRQKRSTLKLKIPNRG